MSRCKQCRDRRDFLKLGGLSLVVSAIDPALLEANPALERVRTPGVRATGKTFIHVWLRGGQDGLNVTVPIEAGEYALYQSYRPNLQVPLGQLTPQELTPDFALHPLTATGLYDLYQQGQVAVLPTVGYPDSARSHFDSRSSSRTARRPTRRRERRHIRPTWKGARTCGQPFRIPRLSRCSLPARWIPARRWT